MLPTRSYRGRDERVPLKVAGPQGVSVVLPGRTAWRLNVGTDPESLRAPRCSPGHVGRGQKTPGQVGSSLASFLGFILEVYDGEEESFHVMGVSHSETLSLLRSVRYF